MLCAFASLAWLAVWIVFCQPVFSSNPRSSLAVDPVALQQHVWTLSEKFSPRSYLNAPNLERCVDYIASEFQKRGAQVDIQEFSAGGRRYRNVIGKFGRGGRDMLIVGAHYDAFGETRGADDNASGVAGLIELCGLLSTHPVDHDVELVAYCLEEPPFFRTNEMGSAIHAAELNKSGVSVAGVVILEMIGFFSDAAGSQQYPSPALRLWYPGRGDFIAVAGRLDQRQFVRGFKAAMKGTTSVPVYSINAPVSLPGLDFSDHQSYWRYGYPALMVTDTAFYRNPNYHSAGDVWPLLDYSRMADVVVMVYEGLKAVR